MKKLRALALIGMMAFSMSAAAFAEAETEGEIQELTYEMMSDVYEGSWISSGVGYDLYLPNDWEFEELDEEQQAAGIVFVCGNQETGRNVTMVAEAEDAISGTTLEALETQLSAEGSGYSDFAYLMVNDIEVLSYDNKEAEVAGLAWLGEGGRLFTMSMGPTSDEEFKPIAQNILLSLSMTGEEAETEATTE